MSICGTVLGQRTSRRGTNSLTRTWTWYQPKTTGRTERCGYPLPKHTKSSIGCKQVWGHPKKPTQSQQSTPLSDSKAQTFFQGRSEKTQRLTIHSMPAISKNIPCTPAAHYFTLVIALGILKRERKERSCEVEMASKFADRETPSYLECTFVLRTMRFSGGVIWTWFDPN